MISDPNMSVPGADPTARVPAPVAITQPMPATPAATTKYYVCSVPAASFFREDGKKIAFVQGLCETNLLHDQRYLDNEIAAGSIYLREANEDEVHAYHMKRDPRGTIKEEVRAEIVKEVENDLRAKIEAELLAKFAGNPEFKTSLGQDDTQKLAGTSAQERLAAIKAKTQEGVSGVKVIMQGVAAPITPISTQQLGDNIPASGV